MNVPFHVHVRVIRRGIDTGNTTCERFILENTSRMRAEPAFHQLRANAGHEEEPENECVATLAMAHIEAL
jgi:hypothetical protein